MATMRPFSACTCSIVGSCIVRLLLSDFLIPGDAGAINLPASSRKADEPAINLYVKPEELAFIHILEAASQARELRASEERKPHPVEVNASIGLYCTGVNRHVLIASVSYLLKSAMKVGRSSLAPFLRDTTIFSEALDHRLIIIIRLTPRDEGPFKNYLRTSPKERSIAIDIDGYLVFATLDGHGFAPC
jgi:hypothetical protein